MADKTIVILPSKLHQFAYCPRQVWFDHFIPIKKPLPQRIRMFIGRLLHMVHHLFKIGYAKEQLLEVEIPELGVKLVGKPDAYKADADAVFVEEFKSYRAPRKPNRWGLPVWESDLVQTLAYAYMLRKIHSKDVLITVRYIDTSATFQYDEKLESVLMLYIDQYRRMAETGILPDAERGRKCEKCIYREICDKLDSEAGTNGEHVS